MSRLLCVTSLVDHDEAMSGITRNDIVSRSYEKSL
jgi:hypothetical protein